MDIAGHNVGIHLILFLKDIGILPHGVMLCTWRFTNTLEVLNSILTQLILCLNQETWLYGARVLLIMVLVTQLLLLVHLIKVIFIQ
ncbi:ORF039 [Staphylococcus phage EW]|uniref:ORF039 n=1 Tax=Staphylococcus phage EW TaxID=2936814 RepID=Q4ZC49_9CAUD|nr:ORF039 [Staphylococcus phage EW]AAX91377.1 ORF039 [Staphylococcus phage EW]